MDGHMYRNLERGDHAITEIRVRILDEERNGLVGFASCVLSGAYFLNNIAIRRGSDGTLFLSYPASRSSHDVEHFYWNPISKEASKVLEAAILGRLREMGR